MQGEGLFSTIAAVAISLAGFSGIVLAVGRQGTTLTDVERYRFSVLMWNALGATFLALVPPLLHVFGLDQRLWIVASAIMAMGEATLTRAWVARSLHQMRAAPEIFHRRTFITLVGMHVGNVVLQTAAAVGLADGPGVYAIGLVVLLAHAANQFLRMLFRPVAVTSGPGTETSGSR